ncbi:hypothetical protein [Faecalibacter sp. LW9]|uniref:hypothetical protein n=1 Tax=Faecalibacter sp. LW9 TaxID=3103144 RepID=UPI002AFE511B|nr:hypothetical protein [Faecalibacter sp. LW9]
MKFNYRHLFLTMGLISLSFTACSTNTSSKKVVYKKVEKPVTKPTAPVTPQKASTQPVEEAFKVTLPEINREFRAAWVATVANIN